MARRRRNLPSLDQINLTSLLDLTFVLLIAFMIVAPSLRPEMKVDLPDVQDNDGSGNTDKNSIIVVIKEKAPGRELDRIYIVAKGKSDQLVTLPELKEKLRDAKIRNPKTNVNIETDSKATAELFLQVLGAVRTAGFENVDIPIEALKD